MAGGTNAPWYVGGEFGRENNRAEEPLPRLNLLDHVVFALTGTPDALLTPEDMRDRTQRRRQANSMAVSASQDPGEGYMWAPQTGGSGFGLNDILTMFRGNAGGAESAGTGEAAGAAGAAGGSGGIAQLAQMLTFM